MIIQGSKYRWHLPTNDLIALDAVCATHNISKPIAQTLHTRGYTTAESMRAFLFTSHEQDVADGSLLKGALVGVERLMHALKNQEKILIFGDYDVDGITSAAMFMLALIPLESNINFYLPNRVKDGYGLSSKIVRKAFENGYSLIITVDNGITAHEAAHTAQELGIDLIITDHHRPHDAVPPALSIINPNQEDCGYPHKNLAGVGVTFKLLSLLFEKLGRELPLKVYELLMLGTIADVVPLVRENRFWVRHGLTLANRQRSYALHVLAHNGKVTNETLSSLDIGFMIAPQLNALGRLDDPRDAVKFLISSNQDDVQSIGEILKNINEERKRIDRKIYQQIDETIAQGLINLQDEFLIMAAHHEWPAGVIGLVAGKLMHTYARPTMLFHLTRDGIAKGSCRSIPEFNMFNALAENKDLLLSFGGHSLAAGLSLKEENLPLLKERLEARLRATLTKDQLYPRITIDAPLMINQINHKLTEDLAMLEPFGHQNPEPLFYLENVYIQKEPHLLKDLHVKCTLFSDGILKPIIFFNRPDLYPLLQGIGERPFKLAAQVVKKEWNGRTSIELQGVDIAL